jgi:ribonucleoside-diphosphate reductase alpha chain
MNTRHRLPNRREHQVIPFEFGGIGFTARLGRYDDGRLAEVFIDSNKAVSAVKANAKAAAIILSLALQHGVELATIAHARPKNGNGRPASPIGTIVEILMADQVQRPAA